MSPVPTPPGAVAVRPPELRLALIIAGGVSLGAYEAGVLDELIHTLESLNARPDRDRQCVIDVITGGSAGAMNGALLARALLRPRQGGASGLREAWVERVDIDRLLDPPKPRNALVSPSIIDAISEDLLVGGGPAALARPSCAPDRLSLVFSLSNMNGVDYAQEYTPPDGKGFISTFFSDTARFSLTPAGAEDDDAWRRIADAAKASGAFPFAFPPRLVERRAADYPGSVFEHDPAFSAWRPAFIDGGLFNNEPLREAIHAAAARDEFLRRGDERIFILIDPFINESQAVREVSPDDAVWKHLGRFLAMIRAESAAKDYLKARRTNDELAWRDRMVGAITDMISSLDDAAARRAEASMAFAATDINEARKARAAEGSDVLTTEEAVEEAWHAMPAEVRADPRATGAGARSRAIRAAAFVLNNAAGLRNKKAIRLSLLGARPSELAGDLMSGFGGFFRKEWREHDYRRGRIRARVLLPAILGYGDEIPRSDPEAYRIPPEWRGFGRLTMKDVPPRTLSALCDRIVERIEDVARDGFNVPGFVLFMLRGAIRRRVKAFLGSEEL